MVWHFKPFSFLAEYKPIFSGINYASLNILTILAIFMIGLELGKINGEKNLFRGLLALICFISVTPTTIELMVNGDMQKVTDVIARQFTDTKSLFLGIFISIPGYWYQAAIKERSFVADLDEEYK
nr:hypothetical protein [Paenibacillus polymyxa]